MLGAGDYIISINDEDTTWHPYFGLVPEARTDYCRGVPYDMTISGEFIPTGRWEGNEEQYPTPFIYTPQVPEPGTAGLALLTGGAALTTRRRRRGLAAALAGHTAGLPRGMKPPGG